MQDTIRNIDVFSAPVKTASFPSSSLIKAAEYDPFMRVLTVHFQNDCVYDFIEVEEKCYEELLLASSAGKYFHECIRPKHDFLRKR